MKSLFQDIRYRPPQWKVSLTFSVMMHLLLAALILLYPQPKREEGTLFFTRLVTPEELKREFPSDTAKGFPGAPSPGRIVVPKPAPRVAAKPGKETARVPLPLLQPEKEGAGRDFPDAATGGGQGPYEQEGSPVLPGADIPKRGSAGSQKVPGKVSPPATLREKLFDREIVERLAKREEKTVDNTITFDTKEFKYEAYMLRLKERIERIWIYPPEAAMRGIYGDLYIQFTIKKDGRLADVELLRTSGHRSLDQAAMRALKDGEPYWPLPDEWGKDSLPVTGHFIYSIYGTYLR